MTAFHPGDIATASRSDVGRVRTVNEDCCDEFHHSTGARLLVLADGMGGHRGGATASNLAVEAIGEVFSSAWSDPAEMLREALTIANRRVFERSESDPSLKGMGTTAVSVLFDSNGSSWVAHVGDSRAYRLREGSIEPITRDHSVVAEMLRVGQITPEQAATDPRRNQILRSLGVDPLVDPDISRLDVHSGDRLLLCSDGLSDLLSDGEIGQLILGATASEAVQMLVNAANERGGTDNVTVQVADVCPDLWGSRPAVSDSADSNASPASSFRVPRLVAAAVALVAALTLCLVLLSIV